MYNNVKSYQGIDIDIMNDLKHVWICLSYDNLELYQ